MFRIPVQDENGFISHELQQYLEKNLRLERYTTTQIEDKSSSCNKHRFSGKRILNVTTDRVLESKGKLFTSPWVDGVGATQHTPV